MTTSDHVRGDDDPFKLKPQGGTCTSSLVCLRFPLSVSAKTTTDASITIQSDLIERIIRTVHLFRRVWTVRIPLLFVLLYGNFVQLIRYDGWPPTACLRLAHQENSDAANDQTFRFYGHRKVHTCKPFLLPCLLHDWHLCVCMQTISPQ